MLRVALQRSATRGALLPSACVPNLWFKPLSIRAGRRTTLSHINTLALNLAGNLMGSCRQAPIRTNSLVQWPASRVLQARFFSAKNGPAAEGSLPVLPPRSVGTWLMVSSTLVFAIIIVGGITRLTESGLSITEWRPVTGILPPLTHEEWVVEFDKYKGTPEFKMYVFTYFQRFHNTQLILRLGLILRLHSMTSSSSTAWNGVTVS
jgi:hypothetical protein